MKLENSFTVASSNQDDFVFPALMSVYRDQGYEIGYLRGRSDLLALLLEAIEDFARQNSAAGNPRQLLYSFSEYLQQQMGEDARSHYVSEGLGI